MPTIHQLLSDNTRGATSIFRDSLQLFLSYPDETAVQQVINEAKQLKNQFNSMGVFYNLWNTVQTVQEPTILRNILNDLLSSIDENQQAIARIGGNHLPASGTVLTISNSTMVESTIRYAYDAGKNLKILCLRSAPANEGELLASSLKNAGIKVELLEDDTCQNRIEETDLVMLGCDLLGKGFFINKRGSGSLAGYAERMNKPVWILGDTLRVVMDGDTTQGTDPLFERVPYSSTMKIACEKGFLGYKELKEFILK